MKAMGIKVHRVKSEVGVPLGNAPGIVDLFVLSN